MLGDLYDKDFIHDCNIARATPSISHCFFRDGSYFFFKAYPRECRYIKDWLRHYEEASGQRINLDKSTVSFSPNVPEATKAELCFWVWQTQSW